jgi:esterase/lipase superfamily enzyme
MEIDVFFATNRAAALTADPVDTHEAVAALRIGVATITRPQDPLKTEAPGDITAIRLAGTTALDEPLDVDCAALLSQWFTAAAAPDAVPLVFVHGFAGGFADALRRTAQLAQFYGDAGPRLVPLLFTWPSGGKVFDLAKQPTAAYTEDQAAAKASGPAFARLLHEVMLARKPFPAAARLALLAHSMGNWALENAMASFPLAWHAAKDAPVFRSAVLAAPDIAREAPLNPETLGKVAELAAEVTIAINADPVTDVVSVVANKVERVGHWGPKSLAGLAKNVQVVDCANALDPEGGERLRNFGGTEWDLIGHQYYRNDRNVRADLAVFLAGKDPVAAGTRKPILPPRKADERQATHVLVATIGSLVGAPKP